VPCLYTMGSGSNIDIELRGNEYEYRKFISNVPLHDQIIVES